MIDVVLAVRIFQQGVGIMNKHIFPIAFVLVAVVATLLYAAAPAAADTADPEAARLVAAAAQKPAKVYICHAVGGGYNLLHISEKGLNGHANHPRDTDPTPDPQTCPGAACAEFTDLAVSGFGLVTVSWTDLENTTAGYVVEGFNIVTGTWSPMSAVVFHEADGNYSVPFASPPFVVIDFRVVASCGEISEPVSLGSIF